MAEKFVEWKRDAPPSRMYYFMLKGKPYRGAYNRKYMGKQILYYTGVKPTRHSELLEYIPKGFEVEDEPVINMMDRWLHNKPVMSLMRQRHEEQISEQPLYGSIVGHNGISNETVRRPEVGYQIVKRDPFTGKRNVLQTTIQKRGVELQKEQQLARAKQKEDEANVTNQALLPKAERRQIAYRKRLEEELKQIEQEAIEASLPKPVAPPVYAAPARKTLKSGVKATEFLSNNKDFVREYIDTLTDRGMNSIVKKVSEQFKVNEKRALSFIARNEDIINKNK
jgi:hypothetical protein